MIKQYIINILYKLISIIDHIDYHYIRKEKLIDNYKTIEEIPLEEIEILTDTGYKGYKMWQFSSTGRIPGIKGDVDLDVMVK